MVQVSRESPCQRTEDFWPESAEASRPPVAVEGERLNVRPRACRDETKGVRLPSVGNASRCHAYRPGSSSCGPRSREPFPFAIARSFVRFRFPTD